VCARGTRQVCRLALDVQTSDHNSLVVRLKHIQSRAVSLEVPDPCLRRIRMSALSEHGLPYPRDAELHVDFFEFRRPLLVEQMRAIALKTCGILAARVVEVFRYLVSRRAQCYRIIALSAVASVCACAQGASSIPSGARVRVVVLGSGCTSMLSSGCRSTGVTGIVSRSRSDSLEIRIDSLVAVAIPRNGHYRVLVSEGTSRVRSAVRNGVLFGLVAALATSQANITASQGLRWVAGITVTGAVAGALQPEERWKSARP
jgi:hypothetical protein